MPAKPVKKTDLKLALEELSATREEIRLLKCAVLTLCQVQYGQRAAAMPGTILSMYKNYVAEDTE